MKKILWFVLVAVLTADVVAQDCGTCQGSNTLSLTTGLTTSGTLLAMPSCITCGVPDPYWQLVNVAPPSINGAGGINIPNAYTIKFGSAAFSSVWVNIPGADALSAIPNHNFPTNNSVANQPWRFLRKFYLCQNASVHFVVDHIGDDNDTLNIFDSNGALVFTQNIPTHGWGDINHVDTNLNMHAGCCYMTVELKNTGGALMGFAVKANLTVTNNSLSNPRETCCATSTISVQKILDANCNGKFDNGELPGVGWTFNLLSGSSVIQTGTTDANGELSFYNVPNGTYTLQEVMQSGYAPGTPSNGQYTVVVSTANSVQTFQFLNCKSNASPTPSPTPSPSPTPTPTSTPTPPPCAQVVGDARCLPSGGYSYTFTVTNNSSGPISQILLTPAQGSTFTLSPQLTNLSSALNNGQSTTVTTTIGNAKPGDKVCFFVSLMSEKTQCCIVQVCLTLPDCDQVTPTPTVTGSLPPPLRQQAPRGRRRP
jgi:hypothetical protein